MAQLLMRWTNDGTPAKFPELPENMTVERINERENGVDEWLDIVQYDLAEEPATHAFYKKLMTDFPGYEEDKCYIFCLDGEPVATTCVICNKETKEGYIHMVGSKPEIRGRGIGRLMNDFSIAVIKSEGMETAHLTTDDWRIPAIKSYLRLGFVPDESTDDYKERWAKIREIIG